MHPRQVHQFTRIHTHTYTHEHMYQHAHVEPSAPIRHIFDITRKIRAAIATRDTHTNIKCGHMSSDASNLQIGNDRTHNVNNWRYTIRLTSIHSRWARILRAFVSHSRLLPRCVPRQFVLFFSLSPSLSLEISCLFSIQRRSVVDIKQANARHMKTSEYSIRLAMQPDALAHKCFRDRAYVHAHSRTKPKTKHNCWQTTQTTQITDRELRLVIASSVHRLSHCFTFCVHRVSLHSSIRLLAQARTTHCRQQFARFRSSATSRHCDIASKAHPTKWR